MPDSKDNLIRHYTFNDTDLSIIRQRRRPANRLGFAVQLCYLRFPGVILGVDELPFPPLLKLVADQLKVGVESWKQYGQREQTRREHLSELQTVFGFRPHHEPLPAGRPDADRAGDANRQGIVLASALIGHLRRQSVILPPSTPSSGRVPRRSPVLTGASTTPWPNHWRTRIAAASTICSSAGTTANDLVGLVAPVSGQAKFAAYAGTHRTPQGMAGTRSAYRHRAAGSPEPPAQDCPRGRPDDTRRASPDSSRNGATPLLVALATEGMATVTDEIIDLHDRILGKLFNAAKNKHQQQFQASGKAINAKVRLYGRIGQALIDAKRSGRDAFAAIEAVMSRDSFARASPRRRSSRNPMTSISCIASASYATLRRYAPEFLPCSSCGPRPPPKTC